MTPDTRTREALFRLLVKEVRVMSRKQISSV
jgi:hypothetical protein